MTKQLVIAGNHRHVGKATASIRAMSAHREFVEGDDNALLAGGANSASLTSALSGRITARRWIMAVGAQAKNAPPKKRRIASEADSPGISEGTGAAKRPINELAPIIQLAALTFRHELPELLRLRTPRRQWVAYEGSRRLGFGASKHGLFKKCVRQGAERDNLYLRYIAPEEQSEAEVLFDV